MPSNSVVFDRAADFYDDTRGFPPGEEIQVAALFQQAGRLAPDSRVLEVGIGTGRIALPVSAHVRAVFGLDLSRPMLDRLRAKRTTEPVWVAEGDIIELPFGAGTFDAVLAVHIFHLVPGWRDALREVARVLKPGRPLVTGYNYHPPERHPMEKLMWDAWDTEIPRENAQNVGVPRDQYDTYLIDSGWRLASQQFAHHFTQPRTLARTLAFIEQRKWSHLWRLSDDELARGLAAARRALADAGVDLEQPYEFEHTFLIGAYLPPEV